MSKVSKGQLGRFSDRLDGQSATSANTPTSRRCGNTKPQAETSEMSIPTSSFAPTFTFQCLKRHRQCASLTIAEMLWPGISTHSLEERCDHPRSKVNEPKQLSKSVLTWLGGLAPVCGPEHIQLPVEQCTAKEYPPDAHYFRQHKASCLRR